MRVIFYCAGGNAYPYISLLIEMVVSFADTDTKAVMESHCLKNHVGMRERYSTIASTMTHANNEIPIAPLRIKHC